MQFLACFSVSPDTVSPVIWVINSLIVMHNLRHSYSDPDDPLHLKTKLVKKLPRHAAEEGQYLKETWILGYEGRWEGRLMQKVNWDWGANKS